MAFDDHLVVFWSLLCGWGTTIEFVSWWYLPEVGLDLMRGRVNLVEKGCGNCDFIMPEGNLSLFGQSMVSFFCNCYETEQSNLRNCFVGAE